MSSPDPQAVNAMFARIAPRYDLVNRVLTGGIDLYWRKLLTRRVAALSPQHVVDLATGSGDVAFALRRTLPRECSVMGLDFCQPMLDQANNRQERKKTDPPIVFRQGDILNLELEDQSADAVTISFGLRNLADRPRGLAEIRRILRPGGELIILEFTQPYRLIRPFYFFYLRRILPYLAGILSGDLSAYRYLNQSIEAFPNREEISEELKAAGFQVREATPLTGGIVCLHRGQVPPNANPSNLP
ncbi:MAG: bifunctional demethylmenaquinone methyltransferase/2-methoxy-6-polyprenyl-1,4-benzoquinol methylase UbiE [Opitutales bacterium]|nr:bifunctional demethylmenaquinone methyltransferase/2-methoxy-6-polyprenyl-1,4-benzoquinol methylase UbiE [Opitutales bacterium]